MFQGIFTMCRHTDQRMDVIEQQMQIVHHNQEIIHSQRDELFLEFLDMPVYPPIDGPYVSLTPTELATFGMGPSHSPTNNVDDDDDDEEAANDDEEMTTSSPHGTCTSLSLFPFRCLDANEGEDSYLYLSFFIVFLSVCNGFV
jgi:hypothetical protein